MNKIILPATTYLITIIYILVSEKLLYLCTLKYYSLLRYISNDRNSMISLNNRFINYRRTVRYFRIHVTISSLITTANIFLKLDLIIKIIGTTLIIISIVTIIDALTLKTRLINLEDTIYKIYNNLQEDKLKWVKNYRK